MKNRPTYVSRPLALSGSCSLRPTQRAPHRLLALALACGGLSITSACASPQSAAPTPAVGSGAVGSGARALEGVSDQNAVLIYVDYLTGLDDQINTIPAAQFRNNVTAFLKLRPIFPTIPAAVVGDEGDYRGRFYPEVRKYAGDARYFKRTQVSAFTPELAEWLESTDRRRVIIGGISIDNCTLHTALDLLRNGYEVHVVTDVSGTNNRLAEDVALRRLERAGAVLTSWISVATELLGDWSRPEGATLAAVMQEHLAGSTVGEVQDPSPEEPTPTAPPQPE